MLEFQDKKIAEVLDRMSTLETKIGAKLEAQGSFMQKTRNLVDRDSYENRNIDIRDIDGKVKILWRVFVVTSSVIILGLLTAMGIFVKLVWDTLVVHGVTP